MRPIIWAGLSSVAVAASESTSSFFSSSSLSSNTSRSSTGPSVSNSTFIEVSRSRDTNKVILASTRDSITTPSVTATSTSGSALATTQAPAIPSLSRTVAAASSFGNSTVLSATPTPTGPLTYVNPWAGNFSGSVPPHGTGSNYALQCQNAYFSWTSVNTDYMSVTASLYNLTSVIRSTTVYEVHTYYTTSYYTLCDGHPRVITSMPTATSTTVLPPSTTVLLNQGFSFAELSEPNCTVSYDDCSGLWDRYSTASSLYDLVSFSSANTIVSLASNADYWVVNGKTTTFPQAWPWTIDLEDEIIERSIPYGGRKDYIIVTEPPPGDLFTYGGYTMSAGGPPVTIEHVIDFTNTPYTPHCRTEKPTCTANQRCQIGGDRVEVFFFPPQTNISRDMCATAPTNVVTTRPPTNFTWTPITTGPYTVLPGNTTWYSGNIYVSLNRINAECIWSNTRVEVGDSHHGEILTMAPSELFSLRAFPMTTGRFSGGFDFEEYAYPFNTEDLISPYPWSAWAGAPDCVKNKCTSINGSYNPYIAVPEAIRRLDPRWATCDLALYGLYDPPKALSTVGNIFATTTARDPIQQPTPGSSPPQSFLQPTRVPPRPSVPMERPPEPSDNNPPPDNSPENKPPLIIIPPIAPPRVTPPENNPPENNPPENNPPVNNPPQNSPPGNNLPPNPPPQPGATPPPTPTTVGSVGGQPIVVNPTSPGNVVIGTQTLNPGGPGTTVGGTSIWIPDPSHVIVSGPGGAAPSTINIPQPGPAPAPTTIATIGGSPVVVNPADPSHVIVDGTRTLTPGAPAIIVGPTSISMANPSEIVISAPGAEPTTINIPQPNAAAPTAGVIITLPGGELVTATAIPGPSGSSVLVSGTLISVGGTPVTLPNGVVLSAAPSGTGIVVIDPSRGATSTLAFSSVSGIGGLVATPYPTPGAVVTIGGETYTVIDQGGSVIIPELGVTLTHGGPASTVNGTVISDAGTGVVVGTTTAPFSTVSVSNEPTGEPGGVEFPGSGAKMRVSGAWGWVHFMLGLGMVMALG